MLLTLVDGMRLPQSRRRLRFAACGAPNRNDPFTRHEVPHAVRRT